MRYEHIVRAGECTKHDRRLVEQVALVQEFGCYDERQRVWVDELWCAAWQPPFAAPGKNDHYRLLYFKDKHCLNRCEPAWRITWMCVILEFLAVISCMTAMIGERLASKRTSIPNAANGSPTSSPNSPLLTSPTPTVDYSYLRTQLAAANSQSWAICRLMRVLYYLHVYGMDVLTFPWRLLIRTLLLVGPSVCFGLIVDHMVWQSDSHCRFFLPLSIFNGIGAGFLFIGVIVWAIRQLQQPKRRQTTINHIQGMYAHRMKEEEYQDR